MVIIYANWTRYWEFRDDYWGYWPFHITRNEMKCFINAFKRLKHFAFHWETSFFTSAQVWVHDRQTNLGLVWQLRCLGVKIFVLPSIKNLSRDHGFFQLTYCNTFCIVDYQLDEWSHKESTISWIEEKEGALGSNMWSA